MTFFILILGVQNLHSQISPGDLSNAHKELEGVTNCTQCHTLGKNVTNQKCLDCHTEIKSLVQNNKGYHSNSEVKNKNCFECHNDHHGRNFQIVRFNENDFDHNLTGYTLEGKHNQINCKDCHQTKFIEDKELKKRNNTFLGLSTTCLSCHEDYHQQTLSTDCLSCHNMNGFKPASIFDHSKTEYPLIGKHESVTCLECHEVETRYGKKFQNFTELVFNDCISCHKNPHQPQLPGDCKSCHTEVSFRINRKRFNHNQTNFTLNGAHKKIDCFTCHSKELGVEKLFQDEFDAVEETNCISCHEDVHKGKFGTTCIDCHSETSFYELKNEKLFDHNKTDYPLEGLHTTVECKNCHKTEHYTDAIDFSACKNCHDDYHKGEFTTKNPASDCIDCHTVESSFENSTFDIERHNKSGFVLEGSHLATPCFACHVDERKIPKWNFHNIGKDCIDCHKNIHENQISQKYYPENDCTKCHSTENWASIDFDHSKTNWDLSGAHNKVNCRECHINFNEDRSIASQKFQGLSTQCFDCHENIHGDKFEKNGITNCDECHVTNNWTPSKFDHNTTRFPLEGKHTEVDCKACHEITDTSGTKEMIYKINKLQCIDCHNQ